MYKGRGVAWVPIPRLTLIKSHKKNKIVFDQ